ncbi:uncharacterized protein ATNIH1004_006610 [Aspergillus tanneri]|uniref:Uncharacterized protein n=1 Tax=Aspergillus tanneri TaxID=1220188 RepID=A0A5M9MLL8_9EURO|nr:uncharacterized protein ATNIH1004_006610 [Aspergillus tanneri]KAA8647908.1 hypothetical protein ATNIH1004_006610 [Aspergillus tanneri]
MAGGAKYTRAVTACDILNGASDKIGELVAFFERDQTSLIDEINLYEDQQDMRTTFLRKRPNRGRNPTISELFQRLLAMRFLSVAYEDWLEHSSGIPPNKWYHSRRPPNHGLCRTFIREHQLPDTSQARGWFECGQKLRRIEREVGIPGISAVMVPVLPKFPHFYDSEIGNTIRLLKNGAYADLQGLAVKLTTEFTGYCSFTRQQPVTMSGYTLNLMANSS